MINISRYLLIIALALAVGFSGSTASANSRGTWTIARASGEIHVKTDGVQWLRLTRNVTHLKPGEQIATGRNGRVLLARGDETIMMSPRTNLALPAANATSPITQVFQTRGTIRLQVEKKPQQHFIVHTPYLAAVVKGTQFDVTVGRFRSSVSVRRGAVQVSDYDSRDTTTIGAGKRARTFNRRGAGLKASPGAIIRKGPGKMVLGTRGAVVEKASVSNVSEVVDQIAAVFDGPRGTSSKVEKNAVKAAVAEAKAAVAEAKAAAKAATSKSGKAEAKARVKEAKARVKEAKARVKEAKARVKEAKAKAKEAKAKGSKANSSAKGSKATSKSSSGSSTSSSSAASSSSGASTGASAGSTGSRSASDAAEAAAEEAEDASERAAKAERKSESKYRGSKKSRSKKSDRNSRSRRSGWGRHRGDDDDDDDDD